MTSKVTFLHTGDLHIGAPVRGLHAPTAAWSERLCRAIVESYEHVIQAALNHHVDFVVIAGDSIDTSKASYGDTVRFLEGLQHLDQAGIPSYVITGNHDPFTSWAKDLDALPPSVHLMGVGAPTFELFQRDGQPLVMLGARSYYNQTWPKDQDIAEGITHLAAQQELQKQYPQLDTTRIPFMVGVIHTGLNWDKQKAPTSENDLYARGVDYWACGHLHLRMALPSWQNPRIAFPGCIQGRNIKETGARGCLLVTLEQAEDESGNDPVAAPGTAAPSAGAALVRTTAEFIPTASIVMQDLEVDVSAAPTLPDVAKTVQMALFYENGKAHCEDMIVRVTLTGQTALYEYLAQPDVLERLRKRLNDAYPNFYCDTLFNQTRPLIDTQAQQREGLLPSLVMQMADDQRNRSDEMINFLQAEFVKRGLSVPDNLSRKIDRSEDEAEMLLLRLLSQEQE